MVALNEFIQIYENALSLDICDFLIDLFEQSSEKHEHIENNRKPNFTQFNLTENREVTETVNEVHNEIIRTTLNYRNEYYNKFDSRIFPEKHAFEQYRIKRYLPDSNEAFDTHVDVIDYKTSRRYLSFMWYLNDNDGGQTEFLDLTIQPEKGKLVVFPPLWMFPHKGNEPAFNPKYILTTYLHYK
jgi:prolyl 4-hydroxylase